MHNDSELKPEASSRIHWPPDPIEWAKLTAVAMVYFVPGFAGVNFFCGVYLSMLGEPKPPKNPFV